mgnify:CR=1 FL=1
MAVQTSKLLAIASERTIRCSGILWNWSERIADCCKHLTFKLVNDELKLRRAFFCHVRLCPLCTARKSLIWFARAAKAFEFLPQGVRFLFLTLTLKNCSIFELKKTNSYLSASYQRFIRSLRFKLDDNFLGHIRSYECTSKSDLMEAHPHLHCLIAVRDRYFEDTYLGIKEWQYLWKRSLQIDYDPVIWIKAVNSDRKAFLEILKYELKPADYINSWRWLGEYGLQINRFRKYDTGGIFREAFASLNDNPHDMIRYSEDEDEEDNDYICDRNDRNFQFSWNKELNTYILRR